MKNVIGCFILSAALSMSAYAQNDFIYYSGPGKIVLASGETVTGKVNYGLSSPAKVEIIPDGQTKYVKYKCDDVKEFSVEDKQYLPVKMKGGAVTIGSGLAFGRLLTPADSKIKIFISETQNTVVVNNNFTITTSYYASVPGDETAYALSDLKFTPFKKMAKYVESCPSLVAKITAKEKGYSYPMVTTDEARLEVFVNVARENQDCK